MSISREDVLRLAELARLELSPEETARAEQELEAILTYVQELQKIDTQGVEPFSMAPKREGWRPDMAVACDGLTRSLIVKNFPASAGELLMTPGVFETPKGNS